MCLNESWFVSAIPTPVLVGGGWDGRESRKQSRRDTTTNRGCELLPAVRTRRLRPRFCCRTASLGLSVAISLSLSLSLSLFPSGGGAVCRVLVWHCRLHCSLGRLAPCFFLLHSSHSRVASFFSVLRPEQRQSKAICMIRNLISILIDLFFLAKHYCNQTVLKA